MVDKSPSSANSGVLPVSRVPRDPPVLQPGLITPIVRLLRLPSPLNPPGSLLVRDGLSLPVLPEERLVIWAEIRSRPSHSCASSDVFGALVGSIIASADSASIEILRTISCSRGPFTHDRQKVEGGEGASLCAGIADVLVVGIGDLLVGEHLIDVDVHGYARPSLVPTGHEVAPVVETLERVVDQDDGVALLGASVWIPNVSKRIVPVLLDRSHHLVVKTSGFVEGSNYWYHGRVTCKLASQSLDDGVRTSNGTTLRVPRRIIDSMAGVVETVLASWGAMQIDDDLQTILTSPVDSFVEIWQLALDIRFALTDIPSPVSNRQPNMVQTRSSDIREIRLSDPGVPMVLQCGLSNRTRLELTEGPFVDDGVVVGVVEQAWGDPGLQDKPTAQIYASNLLRSIRKPRLDGSH